MSDENNTEQWTARSWFLVTMVALMHGLNHSFYVMIAPLFVTLQVFFGFKDLSPVMAIGTAFLAPYGFSHLLFGIIADRISKSLVLGIGGLLASLFLAGAGFLSGYSALLVAVALAGFFAASYHSVSSALLTMLFPAAKGKGLGISGIGATIGLAITPAVSGWICYRYGWQASFITVGAVGSVFSLLFIFTVREAGRHTDRHDSTLKLSRVLLSLMPVIAYMVLREFCGWGSFSLVPTFAQKIHGFTVSEAGRLSMFVTLAGLVAGPLFGFISDRADRIKVLVPLTVLAATLITLLPFLGTTGIFLCAFVYGFFYTATVPVLDALIGDMTPNQVKGIVFGIIVSAGIGIGSLAPVATAAIADRFDGTAHGFHLAFALLGAVLLLSVPALLLSRRVHANIMQKPPV